MGIFKLSKKTVDSVLKQGQDAKKADEFQAAAIEDVQETELCELARQDEGFVEEFKKLRTENETVYRRNDRTCRKIITSVPIRYRNANGELKDISNRLLDNGKEITNEENSFKVKFNKDSKSGKVFDLQKGNNIVSLSATNSANSRGHICGCKCELCAESENTVRATLDGGTEIEYVTLNDRIKENIIVKERQDKYEFFFTLNIGNLTVEEGEKNNLLLKDAATGQTEFIIPAPYMFDANKKYSNNVNYEIDVDGEELKIKVVADADFINSDGCTLPVTIDPQIVRSSEDGVLSFKSECSSGGGENDEYPNMLQVYKAHNGMSNTSAIISVDINKVPKVNGTLTKAVLRITAKSGGKGSFKFYYGDPYVAPVLKAEAKSYELDITEMFLDGRDIVYGALAAYNETNQGYSSEAEFYTSGEYMPKLIIDYVGSLIDTDEGESGGNNYGDPEGKDYDEALETPNLKEFALGDSATGYLNINDGVLSTAFNSFDKLDLTIPLQITNLHRIGTGSGQYGKNWRINLNRKLSYSANDNYTNTVFLYVDEFGDRYLFNETYYYLKNGVKTNIAKNYVEIDSLGNLSYDGNKVYKKQSCNGYVLIPEINDFKGAEYIEQRMQEQIELEEFVNSYSASLSGYVLFNFQTKEIVNAYNELTRENYNNAIAVAKDTDDKIILTKGEIIQLQSIYNTQEQLTVSLDIAKYNYDLAIKNNESYYVITQKENEILALQNQLSNVEEQISHIIAQARKNIDTLKNAFIKFYQKNDELQLLKKQVPVNYLKDNDGLISGFNEYGDLVCIFDSYGNYVSINYSGDKIVSIIDNADNSVSFSYENDLLSSITDNRGRTVRYTYDAKKLQIVTYADGTAFAFKYSSDRINTVVSSYGIQGKASYTDGKLTRIQVYNIVPKSEKISDTSINYGSLSTSVSDDTGNSEEYTFYESGRIKSCRVKDNAVKDQTTEYSYGYDNGKETTAVTVDNVSNKRKTETVKLNDEKLPVFETSDWQNVSDSLKVKVVTEYSYDENGLLLSKSVRNYIDEGGVSSEELFVENYYYNAYGSLILTESFVSGEEQTQGIKYVKNAYDKNGNVTKTISWNSLDSSSKFYSESVLAENGQVMADKDEAGEVSAEYEYAEGTNTVKAVRYANGGNFAYGRNPYNDTITSITQSTDAGEANTTDIVYQDGLPVQVKSGNTVIDYAYDYKGRKSQVTINGVVRSTYRYGKFSNNLEEECVDYGYEEETLHIGGKTCVAKKTKTGRLDEETDARKITESLTVDKNVLFTKSYDVYGRLTAISESGGTHQYSYDGLDNLIKAEYQSDGNTLIENYAYNSRGQLAQKTVTGAVAQTYSFVYKETAARELEYVSFGEYKFKPLTDVNGRNAGKEVYNGTNKIAAEYISYRKVGDHATNMPATVWFGSGEKGSGEKVKDSIKYKYDKCGNISGITENGHISAKYSYDSLNRISREDNKQTGKTVLYSYDNNGNITERCEYDYTSKSGEELSELECTNYSYDYEGDRLVSYNSESFEYNSIGNPTVYRGKTAEWQYGVRLTKLGGTTFAYDGLGRRIKKGEIGFIYDNDGRLIKQSNGLEYIYDNSGVAGVICGGEQYFYRKDAQGNITAILDNAGSVVVRYIYDSWGNHAVVDVNGGDITTGIGVLNPFRYRGYYYDTETGLYYLQTRYYDPEIGRFISQDSIDYADPEAINGLNLYAYCGDNPVMGYDPNGTLDWKKIWAGIVFGLSVVACAVGAALVISGIGVGIGVILLGAGIGGLVGFGGSVISQGVNNGWDNIDWGIVAINGAAGFATCALFASPLGAVATGVSIGLVCFTQSVVIDLYKNDGNWNKVNWSKAVSIGIINGVIAGIGKFFLQNASLQNAFVNNLPWVKMAYAAAGSGSRVAYMSLWKMLILGQLLYQKGITLITGGIRGVITTLINQ